MLAKFPSASHEAVDTGVEGVPTTSEMAESDTSFCCSSNGRQPKPQPFSRKLADRIFSATGTSAAQRPTRESLQIEHQEI